MSIRIFGVDGQQTSVWHGDRALLRLWATVFICGLQDSEVALKLYLRQKGDLPLDHYEPLVWLYDESLSPGSFLWLCDLFEIDADRARGAWRSRITAKVK